MIVTSPAGEQIEVVDVDPPRGVSVARVAQPVLGALWVDGPAIDPSGRATVILLERARTRGYLAARSGLHGLLKNGSLAGYVDREVRGKRTFVIRLSKLPAKWHDALAAETEKRESRTLYRVTCPHCQKEMGRNNIHRHLTTKHGLSHREASDLFQAVKRGAMLPAVVTNGDHAEPEVESVLNDIAPVELVTGMLMAVRKDGHVPIHALPTVQDWLHETERLLDAVSRDERGKPLR